MSPAPIVEPGRFEPDTGLLVNTNTGTVHKPDCEVVTRTTGRSGPWLAPWKGVAMNDSDKPCGYCKPDLESPRAAPSGTVPAPRIVTAPSLGSPVTFAAVVLDDGSEVRMRSLGDRVEIRTWDKTATCKPPALQVERVGKHVIDVRVGK